MQEASSTNELLTPYEKAKLVWDVRMGMAKNQAQSWRLVAFIALLLLAASLVGNIYLGTQSKSMITRVLDIFSDPLRKRRAKDRIHKLLPVVI